MTNLEKRWYEFHAYDAEGEGPTITAEQTTAGGAYSRAGRIAKRNDGPVDIAVMNDEPWDHRYVTTAHPSPYHAKGYRIEKVM